jgi:hypothetical protein
MTVTTSCYGCLRIIRVPVALFDQHVVAMCRDAGLTCRTPVVPRIPLNPPSSAARRPLSGT